MSRRTPTELNTPAAVPSRSSTAPTIGRPIAWLSANIMHRIPPPLSSIVSAIRTGLRRNKNTFALRKTRFAVPDSLAHIHARHQLLRQVVAGLKPQRLGVVLHGLCVLAHFLQRETDHAQADCVVLVERAGLF